MGTRRKLTPHERAQETAMRAAVKRRPKLKAFMVQTFARGPDWPGNEQVYAFVAAPSQKAAAAAFGCSTYELNRWGGVTANEHDVDVVMAAPGTVFVRTLDNTYLLERTYLPATLERNSLHVKQLDEPGSPAL